MAKKRKEFNIAASYGDREALEALIKKGDAAVAPSEKEIKFVTETAGEYADIPLGSLVDYHKHSFKVLDNRDMDALVESISKNGILVPLIVRKKDNVRYEIITGHRRKHAAVILGLETVPCKIVDVDDATADIMMVDTNLHRSEILPSEKAMSYDIKIRAMQRKGMETDAIESDDQYMEEIAKDENSSKATVYRYRKLVKLIPPLLDLVDEKKISVNAGAELTGIPNKEQPCIISALERIKDTLSPEDAERLTISIKDAKELAKASRNGLTEDKVIDILRGEFKPRRKKTPSVPKAIREKNISKSYPATIKKLSGEDKEAFIIECIEEYIKTHDTWNGMNIK